MRSEGQTVRINHQQSFSLLLWCFHVPVPEIYCNEISQLIYAQNLKWNKQDFFGDGNVSCLTYQANLSYI